MLKNFKEVIAAILPMTVLIVILTELGISRPSSIGG